MNWVMSPSTQKLRKDNLCHVQVWPTVQSNRPSAKRIAAARFHNWDVNIWKVLYTFVFNLKESPNSFKPPLWSPLVIILFLKTIADYKVGRPYRKGLESYISKRLNEKRNIRPLSANLRSNTQVVLQVYSFLVSLYVQVQSVHHGCWS